MIELDCSRIIKPFDNEALALKDINPMLIHVLARSWDEQDLAGIVKEVAIKSGMEKVYVEMSEGDV